MDNSRRSSFMEELDARQYNRSTHNTQLNNQRRTDPSIRSNNTHQQYRRNIKNSAKTRKAFYIRKGAIALTTLIAAGILIGTAMQHDTNKNIDNVYEAFTYTQSVLPTGQRAIDKEGYQEYIEQMVAYNKTFEDSNKKNFHKFVNDDGLKEKVLDPEQVTNLALEVFKVAFGEKYGVDPSKVKIKHDVTYISQLLEEYNYTTGKRTSTSILYETNDGKPREMKTAFIEEGYGASGSSFERSGNTIYESDEIPPLELASINAILAGQSNEKKAFNTIKTNMTYAEEVRDGSQQQQASDERED